MQIRWVRCGEKIMTAGTKALVTPKRKQAGDWPVAAYPIYSSSKCLKSRLDRGSSFRQPVAFFMPVAHSMEQGEVIRNDYLLGHLRDFNTLTSCLAHEIVNGSFRSQIGARHD